ncbi:metallophosphoesterase family protein [Paenibacillus luteus]|uniref:metallophosphoesterase family protein n=1 Tax=Paenibacillus luteus TaxID=2545753 RepID=UPI001142BF8A|nr:metallophosphoesterase [Paenibacillus luteus]
MQSQPFKEKAAPGDEQGRSLPILSFQVITDTHVTAESDHIHNEHFGQALRDIAAHAASSVGIMHVGDVTDRGLRAEYEELTRIWQEHKASLPPMWFTYGNHDIFLGEWSNQLKLYERFTGMNGPYYDVWLDGFQFIFLGSERGLKDFAYLTEEQLAWLDEKLSEEVPRLKPVFVFLHQPLKNTVAGSLEAQGWYGVTQDEELKAILAKHPQVIMFNGHTHWELEAGLACYREQEGMGTIFNAASVAYLWTNEDEYKEGSQGYYVDVYNDKVVVRGRNFANSTWLSAAVFEMKL